MFSDWIPAPVRLWTYRVLSTAFALELVFDVVADGVQQKIVEAAAVLGFSLAAVNTPR
jgi:hypothetical protein